MHRTRAVWLTGIAGVATIWLALAPDSKEPQVVPRSSEAFVRPIAFEPPVAEAVSQQESFLSQDPALEKSVSVSFHGATLDDVLKWLSSQGINFVADKGFPKRESRLSMRVENQPLRNVLLAVADIFAGEWQKQGEIYVLKARSEVSSSEPPGAFEGSKRLELQDPKSADEFAKRMQEWSERFFERWKEFGFSDFHYRDLIKEYLEQQLARGQWREFQGGRVFVFPPGEWRPLDPEQLWKDMPDVRSLIEKYLSERSQRWQPDIREWRQNLPNLRIGGNLTRLFESITSEQWRIQEQRGYLTPNDLTEDQRSMLGFQGGGAMEITISINGKTLKIKSS